MSDTVVFDVDGTLVDTNYHHALAWFRAFRRYGVTPPVWRIHRTIGMGGDQLVGEVAGDEVERAHGAAVRAAWAEEFAPMLDEVPAFEGARELLADIKARGFRLVLASSGKPEHVDRYLDLLDGRSVADAWTTAKDAERTKPAPDLVETALDQVDGGRAVVVGDSIWDCVAARRLGLPAIAVRTGGFFTDELTEAGASAVYETLTEVGAHLDHLPLAAARRAQ
jgi:HAD superfamily hydrolase (TIGR01549 family)